MLVTLLLLCAVVYFLWFHKFVLKDGTEVKGWLAKNKAENESNRQAAAGAQNAPQPAEEDNEEDFEEDEDSEEDEEDLDDEFDEDEDEEEPHERQYGVQLGINSAPYDFIDVRSEALEDLFDTGWERMKSYYGWLLLGSMRNDLINFTTVWFMIHDGYIATKSALEDFYQSQVDSGEKTPEEAETLPAWMANAYLLNGFSLFIEEVHNCFDQDKLDQIDDRLKQWADDLYAAREKAGQKKTVYDEPNAAEFLVRLYNILKGDEEADIPDNIEMFKSQFCFDFELPEVK